MELDQLKTSWQTVNERLETLETRNVALTRAVAQGETQKAASRLRREPIFELGIAILTALWSGGFLGDNLGKIPQMPLGAIPAGLIFLMAIFTVGLSIRQLVLISDLDYSGPILETQKTIATLRSIRVRSTQFLMLLGIPLWVIFPIFLGQFLIGFELVQKMDAAWVLSNLVVGALLAGGIGMAARKWGDRPFFRAINDVLAGTEVTRAQKLLGELEAFAA